MLRRTLLIRRWMLLLVAVLLPVPACRIPVRVKPQPPSPAFAFVVLGDLHIDRLEHHDLAVVEQKHGAGDIRQIQNYSRITETVLPHLFAELRAVVADSKPPVALIVQAGDFVQGLCGHPALAQRQCEDAVAMVRKADFGAPFLITKGNHDVTGDGAVEAYNRVILPFLSEQAGQPVKTASYAYEYGDALFVFYDAYDKASLDGLEQTLEGRRARHVFVVCHPPVVPLGARSTWHVYSSARQQAQRKRLLELLGRHRAIVFAAHLHKFGVIARRTETGRFVQVSLSSVLSSPDARPKSERSGVKQYGADLVELEPDFSPETRQQRREILAAEAPFIEYFEYADAPGYAIVSVAGGRVEAQIYVGLGRRLWKTLPLTDLIK